MGAGCCSVVKTDETRQKKSMRQPDSRGNDKVYV
jgi:Leucine-rich repeat (LRR) protein